MALKKIYAFACLACSAFALLSNAQAQQVEGIAAIVNDSPITTVDVRNRMRLILDAASVQLSEEALQRVQEQALDGLVDETLQLQQAQEFDLEIDAGEVDAALSDIAARNGSTLEEISQELAQSGVDVETLRQQIRAEIAWQTLVNGRYRSRVRISDQQIDLALQRYALSAAQTQYRVAEILVEIPSAGNEEQAIGVVRAIYEQLNQGIPFPALAQQFSDAPSSSTGGDTGWLTTSQMRPQVLQVAQQMQSGQISNPIRVPGGVMIIAVIDKREGQSVEQYTLKQVTLTPSNITPERRQALTRALGRLEGCDSVEATLGAVDAAIVTDLGQISANALIPQVRNALADLEPGQASAPMETAAGIQSFILCDRSIGGPGVPSREQIEDQLIDQQVSLLARRWLRDLRRDAAVIYR
ncbi:peptidylprolyl isomerase [Woodsholea maritima]|uniref:peptidylprolyl isomerase n=1 Tax=Woodsholea maritima TaxID=240237 RepID=UPI000380562A|nr:peptidylprolyl isomerase [Woodsholea maritima]